MKLCLHCTHLRWTNKGAVLLNHTCAHPDATARVSGYRVLPCELVRADASRCGPDAAWFEPKPERG